MTGEQLAEKEYPYAAADDISMEDLGTWDDVVDMQREALKIGYQLGRAAKHEGDIEFALHYIEKSAGNLSKWLLEDVKHYVHKDNIPGTRMSLLEGIREWVAKEKKNNETGK